MKYLTIALILFLGLKAKAQQPANVPTAIFESSGERPVTPQPADSNKIYTAVEQQPVFAGGTTWHKYLQMNLKRPNTDVQGKVFVSFIVERNGSLTDIKVIRSLSPECDQEAIRLVKTSPKWKPGLLNGKSVRFIYTSAVDFGM